jgi:hypothetical protein
MALTLQTLQYLLLSLAGSPIAIASTISVPADASLSLIDKNNGFYLEESDNIEAGASSYKRFNNHNFLRRNRRRIGGSKLWQMAE